MSGNCHEIDRKLQVQCQDQKRCEGN